MDETSDKRTDDEAARWAVRLDADALSQEEQRRLDAWLAAAAHHRGALIRARSTWVDLDRLAALAGGSAYAESAASSPPLAARRWLLAASLAGLAVLGASWLGLYVLDRDIYESAIGEVRRVTLSDGSSLVLNTATRAIVRFTDARREVRLERGEALFQVQKDPTRPFIVRTDDLIVTAVGTAFAVRVGDARVDVTVTEGVVEVARISTGGSAPPPPQEATRVAANQRAIARVTEPVAVEPIAPPVIERRLAWREGRVAFDGEPLSEAVAEVNRHSRRVIVIADPALAARPVVGIFRASDAEGFAQAAAIALGAEATEEGNIIRLVPTEPR